MARLSRSAAALRILGDDLDPAELTAVLGKEPDRFERKGDTIALPKQGFRTASTGSWKINASRMEPGNLDAQVAQILQGTTDNLGVWQDLCRRFDVHLFCGLFLSDENEGFCISPETMRLLGARGIAVDFDIYAAGKE
ncbi:DUF4279 domain-containing protein [Leisingera sp. ANG-DT]|uniref:DUF4279 domain-containing protein n=1 Tax=Leisingera sp. ANG-DT TaxID=1577897 RepID=UPI0005829DD4|nr:DUF4279 domain-containing protein [Leisingera sp. ANG-DT]KIC18577.1 hypothetical protein RA21_04820 [Leisingera sp. ANG-DT]